MLRLAYLKLLRIKDSPLKIALGFGLGVFMGVMPGVGSVVALLFAFIFRVNRVGALLGSLLSNGWVTFMVLFLAIKIGAAVRNLNYKDVYTDFIGIMKTFKWDKLFDVSFYDVFIPIAVGYLIISLFLAAVAALVVYVCIIRLRKKRK
jgi:uncharacterized protein (DUF2062 family)